MSLQDLCSERLTLKPLTLAVAQSLLAGCDQELTRLGIVPSDNWPTEDTLDVLPVFVSQLERQGTPSGFETWMIVEKRSGRVIGDIGFHGPPNELGEVEIGFGLVEGERGKGFGSEALCTLIGWVRGQECVKLIRANCLLENIPSARILRKVGMRETGRSETLIHWELQSK